MQSKVKLNAEGIQISGEHKIILCASLFYFRIPRGLWEKRIKDLIKAGYNTADVYFPWNYHETAEGDWDFDGEKDVEAFLQLCADNGLYVIARPGPYICSEWDGGGLPARVCAAPYLVRSADPDYLNEVKKWYAQILKRIMPYQIDNNGSVILLQLENELDFYDCPNVEGYISALRDYALASGASIPLFCCSGQGNTVKAGGFTPGVYPAFNFYPRITDGAFDGNCHAYSLLLKDKGLPLLISETGREHSLLKREIASGAKLVGAYNQVAGSNFGFTQSINNWGANQPEAVITTQYDFYSMITTLGDFNPEVNEARLLHNTIDALGQKLARAVNVCDTQIDYEAEFPVPEKLNCLALHGGGKLLCVSNLSDKAGNIKLKTSAGDFTARVEAYNAAFLPLELPLHDFGINGKIIYSNAEIQSLSADSLVFYTDGKPEIKLTVNNETVLVTANKAEAGGVKIVTLTKQEALLRDSKCCGANFPLSSERSLKTVSTGKVCDWQPDARLLKKSSAFTMDKNGLSTGVAVYDVRAESGAELLLYAAADFVTAYAGGKYIDTTFMTGNSRIYQPSKTGEYRFKIEKWGHSNFDDNRRRSLRIQSNKGAKGFYSVIQRQPVNSWQFIQHEGPAPGFWPEKLEYNADSFDSYLGVNSWNSTRQPLFCLYRVDIKADKDFDEIMLNLEGGLAECAVYADNILVSEIHPHDRLVVLTGIFKENRNRTLALFCRKRHWAEPTGNAELLYLKNADVTMCAYGEKEIAAAESCKAVDFAFPLKLKPGQEKLVELDLMQYGGGCCYGVIKGTGYKATAVLNGKVIARMLSQDLPVSQAGGSSVQFYIPSVWRTGTLKLYIEATGENSCIESFALEFPRES